METSLSFSASSTKKRQSNARPSALELALANAIKIVAEPHIGQGISSGDQSKIEFNVQMQEEEMERCRGDVVYWICNYFWTYDHRATIDNRERLLNLFPRQVEFVKWLQWMRKITENSVADGLVEKGRDSGISCICCAFALHGWLFEPFFKCGMGSYIQPKVDSLGDPDSLFEKLRIGIRKLPAWMKPSGLKEREHLLQQRITNPANGSIIIGEVGDNIGRGGRNLLYIVDESAYLEHPDLADSALTGNTNLRIDVSTPNGIGNSFWQKRHSLPPEQVFVYKWEDDPRKDQAWKEATIKAKGLIVFEREYNRNYAASIEGVAIPAIWVKSAVSLGLPEIGDLVVGMDVAAEGDCANCLAPRRGPRVLPLIDWKGMNVTQSAHHAMRICQELGATAVCVDVVGVGSGIKGEWDTLTASQDGEGLPFEFVPVVGGERPTETLWPDGKTSRQKFANIRAEMWWTMRERFRKTHEYVLFQRGEVGGACHEIDELISIPDDPQLISELSMPLVSYTNAGKIQIEGKKEMRSRGIRSPDKADAVIYSQNIGEQKRPFRFW